MENVMRFPRSTLTLGVLLLGGSAVLTSALLTMAAERDNPAATMGYGACNVTSACVLSGDGVAGPAESAVTIAPECAAKELRVITWIEQHGEAGDVPSGRLAEAAFTMFDARAACRSGRVTEALASYDRILRSQKVTSTGTD
jgi:hypothetical protein